MQWFGRLCAKRSQHPNGESEHDVSIHQSEIVEEAFEEQFFVCVASEVATFRAADGSHIGMPLRILHRSAQL